MLTSKALKFGTGFILVGLLLAGLYQEFSLNEFHRAVELAKAEGLTQINSAEATVPFFSPKTLDPIWEVDSSKSVVRIPNLNLIDQNSKNFTSDAFDGKYSMVAFFFATCRGFCPMLLSNMKDVERRLQEEGHNLQMIAVSVAPEDDQPEVLKTYAQRMQLGQTWRLLTGDRAQIYSLARDTFAAEAFDLPISKGQVAHSEHLFVVDGQRRLRGVLNGTKKNAPDRASELMAKLSQETESVIP